MWIALTFIAIGVFLVAFFLFAIWRAMLGRTAITFKLSMDVSANSKKMDLLTKALGTNVNSSRDLSTELRDLKRELEKSE